MKKAAFFSLLALCFGFVSCDNYEEPNPPAQSNPQEAVFESNGLNLEPHVGLLVLDAINIQGANVPVATMELMDFPEGYTLELDMELSGDNTFEKSISIPTIITEDGNVTVSPEVMQSAINGAITRDPAPLKAEVRFAAYAVKGSTRVRLGSPTAYYCAETLNVVPLTPSVYIEESYFFVYSKDGVEWHQSDTIRMTRNGGGSLYDNPEFSFTYDFPADMIGNGFYWKIAPASTVLSGFYLDNEMFGPSNSDVGAQSGPLLLSSKGGFFTMDGVVMMTANMYDRTFSYVQAFANFYTPGDINGWTFPYPALYTTDFVTYSGFVPLVRAFKFAPEPFWGRDFGQIMNSPTQMSFREEGGYFVGEGYANGDDDIKVGVDGLNYVTLNYTTRFTTLLAIQTVGLIGDFNNWEKQLNMTPNEDFTEWTTEVTFPADGDWKIRMNDNWDYNLGGNPQNLVMNGDNLKATKGTYNVKLIFKGQPYAVEVTKK